MKVLLNFYLLCSYPCTVLPGRIFRMIVVTNWNLRADFSSFISLGVVTSSPVTTLTIVLVTIWTIREDFSFQSLGKVMCSPVTTTLTTVLVSLFGALRSPTTSFSSSFTSTISSAAPWRPRKGPSSRSPSWCWSSCCSCQRCFWGRWWRRLRALENLLPIVSANQDNSAPKHFNIKEIVLRSITGLRGGQRLKWNLQSVVFQRLFRQEETPLSSTKCLNMSETSLRFPRTFGLTSSFGESWSASKSKLEWAAMSQK